MLASGGGPEGRAWAAGAAAPAWEARAGLPGRIPAWKAATSAHLAAGAARGAAGAREPARDGRGRGATQRRAGGRAVQTRAGALTGGSAEWGPQEVGVGKGRLLLEAAEAVAMRPAPAQDQQPVGRRGVLPRTKPFFGHSFRVA